MSINGEFNNMSIILYNEADENYKSYREFSHTIYKQAGITYPDYSNSGVTYLSYDYPIVHGLPIMIKYSKDCCFSCIDIITSMADRYGAIPCKDFLNLLHKIDYTQRKAIWVDINSNLLQDTMKLMDGTLYEYYDMLLYLYISVAETLVDYMPNWKERYKDEIRREFMPLCGDVYLFKNVITTNIMTWRQKRKPPYFTNYMWCYTILHCAKHTLERIC